MNKIAFSVIASGSLALLIGVADAEASSTYTIKSGDSLWKIASQHNVSVANLKTWNNLSSDAIFPNQVLKVAAAATGSSTTSPAPAPAPSQPVSNATSTYTVKSGDTLSKIASLHKTTVSKIQQLNKISGHLIYPGQKLMVSAAASAPAVTAPKPPVTTAPASTPAPTAGTARTYKVVSGDTLTGIAYRNGISVTQLMNWNGLTSSMIRVGQVLKIENSTAAPSTTPVSNPAPPAATDTVGKIVETAKSLAGTPYVWGGSTASGFDCSGFIYYVYNQAGVKIPRTSTTGYDARSYDISSPQVGDLVFFENTYRAGISHMGIYIGNNQFIHAGGDKVQITSLDNSYWSKHFAGYKRLYAMD